VGFLMVTVCGLVVDEHQQVIAKADDEPIPGLYATGNCSGERFPILYTTPVAGVSIGIAITLGRIVGDYVARNK
jgi:predicted oxidoreductase